MKKMASSDIIKIGFDYRASLEQFEKDTNGVFDGISNKAGKQKITIQLDAKDDKVIDKIKELQKLKLDKFTFEFGDSGLKEQLQTFDKLESKINEIINLGKGKSFIDSSSTVADIGKIENKINELNKKYEEAQKKISSIDSGNVSGKDINLVDNAEFQKLSDSFEKIKGEVDDLKTHMSLLDDSVVSGEQFIKLGEQVEGLSVKFDTLIDKYVELSNAQKAFSSTPQAESNISSGNSSQINVVHTSITSADAIQKENDALEETAQKAAEATTSKEKFSKANQQVKESADESVSSIKDEADAFSQIEWDKNIRAIQDYMNAVTKLNNLKAKDKNTGKNATNISRQEQEVEKLKEAAYEARAALTSMINPHDVGIDTWKDWVNAMKQFDQASLGSAESLAKLEDALRNAGDAQKNYINSVKDKHTGYSNDYQNALSKDGYFPTNAFKEKVAQYQVLYDKLIESANVLSQKDIVSQEQLDSFEELKKECESARQELTKMSASDKGAWAVDVQKEISKITKELHENSNYSVKAKQKLQGFIDQLNAGDISDTTLKKIHEEFLKITNAEKAAGREGKNFIDILKNSGIHKIAADLVGMFSVYDLINLGKQGVSIVRELNTALTEMRKVSDETVQSLKDYQATTFDTADAVGTTAKQIQNSTADWMRLGESMNQAAKSAKTANVLLNVSEFDNIEDATKSLVAMGQAYKDLDKMTIVDKLNEVGKIVAQTYSNVWCYKNIAW